MGFSIAYIKELYEKAYKDGIKASETQQFALAKKKLQEAAVFAKKLAQMDVMNRDFYEKRAEKLKSISDSINVEKLTPFVQEQQNAGPSYQGYAQEQKPEEDMGHCEECPYGFLKRNYGESPLFKFLKDYGLEEDGTDV